MPPAANRIVGSLFEPIAAVLVVVNACGPIGGEVPIRVTPDPIGRLRMREHWPTDEKRNNRLSTAAHPPISPMSHSEFLLSFFPHSRHSHESVFHFRMCIVYISRNR